MTTYTLIITGTNGRQNTTVSEFPDDATAIQDGARALDDDHPIVAVARGSGDAITVLGAWELERGQANWWSEV